MTEPYEGPHAAPAERARARAVAAGEGAAHRVAGPLLRVAHPEHLIDAAPAFASRSFRETLAGAPRIAERLEALLANRLAADTHASAIDLGAIASPVARGLAFLDAEPSALESRLLFLGVVSFGPALRRSVLRDEVAVLVEAIGPRMLKAALARAEIGVDRLGLDLSSAENVLFCFEQRAAEHFAAWLNRLPPALATRARLALSPASPCAPMRPEYGDPTLIPALAPLAASIDVEIAP